MKNTFYLKIVAAIFLATVSNTQAAQINYNELYDPADIFMDASGNNGLKSISWTFDITDNAGWTIPNQIFNNGILTFVVNDDGGSGDGTEKAAFTFDLQSPSQTNYDINSNNWSSGFAISSSLLTDGMLEIVLTATKGDFWFKSSNLTVTSDYTPQTAPVPEPTTMLLFGTGLLGLAAVGRRKR